MTSSGGSQIADPELHELGTERAELAGGPGQLLRRQADTGGLALDIARFLASSAIEAVRMLRPTRLRRWALGLRVAGLAGLVALAFASACSGSSPWEPRPRGSCEQPSSPAINLIGQEEAGSPREAR